MIIIVILNTTISNTSYTNRVEANGGGLHMRHCRSFKHWLNSTMMHSDESATSSSSNVRFHIIENYSVRDVILTRHLICLRGALFWLHLTCCNFHERCFNNLNAIFFDLWLLFRKGWHLAVFCPHWSGITTTQHELTTSQMS